MKFIDEVRISVRGGAGGDGCVSFRREKYIPRGGPDGGDGGNGGTVLLVGRRSLVTLADLQYHNRYQAEDGVHGKGKNMTGRSGQDVLVPVPLGTDVLDASTGNSLGEVIHVDQQLPVAIGGKGGRGNAAFKTHARVAPRIRETGKPGETRELRLVLRLISDVGLVGFPNAGKSTLLSRLTRANPKIADYPFTTLTPNLGVLVGVGYSPGFSAGAVPVHYTVADLPGIIEGAAQGKGLGLRFLRHIERTRVLVFVIDASQPKPIEQYRALCAEIREYNPAILDKPGVLVYNKTDLKPAGRPRTGLPVLAVSALNGTGVAELAERLRELVQQGR
jgi:GTP-binding protein